MSGAGKSTLSTEIKLFLTKKQFKVHVIDGDEIRGKDAVKLGFGFDDVLMNNLRIATLCKKLKKQFDVVVVPVISPYDVVRRKVRKILEPNFHLIYLKCDIDSLRIRDPKGLYASVDKGLIDDMIGYSDHNPYEEPCNAEIVIDTGNSTNIDQSRAELFDYINKNLFVKW